MKRILQSLLLAVFVTFSTSFSCGQSGPTPSTAILTWVQAVPTASSGPVTGNCVYRGTASGVYATPALFCSTTPILTWTDLTVVSGTSYHYAVTAHFGAAEGPYSNDGPFTAPALSAPVLSTIVAKNETPGSPGGFVVSRSEAAPRPKVAKRTISKGSPLVAHLVVTNGFASYGARTK